MNTFLPGLETLVKPFQFAASPHEYKVTTLRECPTPDAMQHCETPDKAAEYWRLHIASHPHFNPDCECLAVLLLNTRRRVKGHQLLSIGTMDTLLAHQSRPTGNNDQRNWLALVDIRWLVGVATGGRQVNRPANGALSKPVC